MVYDITEWVQPTRVSRKNASLSRRLVTPLMFIVACILIVPGYSIGQSLNGICVDYSTCPTQYQPKFAVAIVLYIVAIILFLLGLLRGFFLSGPGREGLNVVITLVAFGLAIAIAVVGAQSTNNYQSGDATAANVAAISSMGFVAGTVGLLSLILKAIKRAITHPGQVILHQYRGNLSGYAWQWREDQPKPEKGLITPKPDLIQKGQERLRRNAQIAAADAYQRQQRGEL